MKELTIEEKVNAIDIVKQMVADGHISQDVAERYFPELAESEDERTRKKLIAFVKSRLAGFPECDRFIAWLKKQGEKKSKKVSLWKHWKDGICGNGEGKLIYLIKSGNTYRLSSCLGGECDYIELSELDNLILEKQGDQKPTDKVEQKFHEGDWLVQNERKNIFKVVNATPLVYKVVDILGYHYTITDTAIENNYHLWTIQDAKDGDVLVWDDGRYTIIFKKLKDNKIIAHCSYNNHSEHFGTQGNYDTMFDSELKFVPITKEQRDALMKAMTDAGYTFDFEKKELKKIENKNPLLSDFFKAEYERGYERGKADAQKSVWSEEDERIIDSIIEDVMPCGECPDYPTDEEREYFYEGNRKVEWLKSLKDRYTWKPTKEQIRRLEYFLKLWGKTDDVENTKVFETVKSLLNDLKRL